MSNECIKNTAVEAAVPQSAISDKKKIVAALLCFFLGFLGVHRFYLGKVGSGIAILALSVVGWLTTGIFIGFILIAIVGIWNTVDFFCILFNRLSDAQGRQLARSGNTQPERTCPMNRENKAAPVWNEVGRKATETTAGVVRKAQNTIGASKINNLILEEDRKRDDIYRKIGKMYASRQEEAKDPAFAPLLEELEQSDGTIRAYEDQILSLKNAYRCTCGAVVSKDNFFCPVCGSRAPRTAAMPLCCTKCGHPVAKGDKFCTKCGQRIEPEKENRCPICNEPIAKGSQFCTRCGNKLENSSPAPAENQNTSESQVYTAQQQPVLDKVCPQCGAKIVEGNTFCSECGAACSVPTLPDKITCRSCGAKIDSENSYCTECGAKLPV